MKLQFSNHLYYSSILQHLVLVLLLLCLVISSSNAFTVTNCRTLNQQKKQTTSHSTIYQQQHHNTNNRLQPLNLAAASSSSSTGSSSLPDVSKMKASELRNELKSYGISTKSFFEKSELIDAVEKARSEGKKPIDNEKDKEDEFKSTSSNSKESSSSSSKARNEKLAIEMEKCSMMKVGELKKELESYGISTKSFFEKSEFVRAVAEARVDGVKNKGGGSRASGSRSRDEEYDPSYRDVQMQKMDVRALGMSPVIDVRLGS